MMKEQLTPDGVFEDYATDINEFIKLNLPVEPMIMTPWLRAGTLTEIYGDRGIGKSFFSLSIAIAITHELPLGPWEVEQPTGILYIDGEMSPRTLQDRAVKLMMGTEAEKRHCLMLLSTMRARHEGEQRPDLVNQRWRDMLLDRLQKHLNIGVVILDCLSALTPGIDENVKKEWDPISLWLMELRALNKAIIFIHHAGKGGAQRGTSGREDNLDTVIFLNHGKGWRQSDGAKFNVIFEKSRAIWGGDTAPFQFALQNSDNGAITWTTDRGENAEDMAYRIWLENKEITNKALGDIVGKTPTTIWRWRKKWR